MSNEPILKSLKIRKKELEKELLKVNNAIDALVPPTPHFMQWKERAVCCITSTNRFCKTTEILECLIGEEEVKQLSYELRKRYITGLSVALSDLHRDGAIMKFNLKGFKGHFYGLHDWFDGAVPKKQYLPNQFHSLDITTMLATGMIQE